MTTLIVSLPPRPRLGPQTADPSGLRAAAELDHVLADGSTVLTSGRAPVNRLPRGGSTVLVLDPADVSWHRLPCPKAPAARLRAALAGTLEESLLEDEADLHLALSPGAKGGEPVWVAATGRAWLQAHIEALEAAGLAVDRVVPGVVPGGTPQVLADAGGPDGTLRAVLADDDGALCVPLASPPARAWAAAEDGPAWLATPAAAAEAERLCGRPVAVRTEAELRVAALAGDWNLRQFELAPPRRGGRALREAWLAFTSPAWRPVRLGLIGLVVVHVIGLQVWAVQQRRQLDAQRVAVERVLRDTFPQVRAVIDAPAQMRKEVDALRTAAGRPGDTDLEPLLGAAEAAWPPARPPAGAVKFEPGRLTLTVAGWAPPDIQRFGDQLRARGLALDATQPGLLVLQRAKATP